MVVSIIGSKDFNNYDIVNDAVRDIKIDKILTGGVNGADKLGEIYAVKHKIKLEIIKPDWDGYGLAGGVISNMDIIKKSDLVFIFWDKKSPREKHAISLAHKYMKNILVYDLNGEKLDKESRLIRPLNYKYKWARVVKRGEPYYECSSKGNKEFSALYAFIDKKSIEEIYQLDIKGYRGKVEHWKEAKRKPPLNNKNEKMLYLEYLRLWQSYLKEKPNLYFKLLKEAKDKTITDMFGVTNINQARALCDLCNNGFIY